MLRTKLPFFLAYARAIKQPIFIEWIQSTGTQYINLGYISPERAKTLRFVADMSIDTTSSWRLCGTGGHLRQLYFGLSLSGAFAYGSGNIDDVVSNTPGNLGIKYHYDYDVLNGLYEVSENSTIVASKQFEFSGYTGGNFYLFCYAGVNEGPLALWSGKIYSFLVYENNTLIHHLRPCLHPQTFEACMYDMVTKQYFYNKGTGSFIPAPRFVEYIESDGNQCILDTLQIEPSHKIVIDGQYTYTGPSYQFVAGSAENDWKNQACIRLHSETTALISAGVSSDLFSINSNQRYLWTLDILNGKGYLDNNEVSSFSGFVPSGSSKWGYIGVLFNDAFYNASVGKTYSIKLYDNEVLIRHLRPCLRGNTPCMYDMVEGKYYMNAGTGTFKYGEIKFVRGANTNTKVVTVRKGKFYVMEGCNLPASAQPTAESDKKEEKKKK